MTIWLCLRKNQNSGDGARTPRVRETGSKKLTKFENGADQVACSAGVNLKASIL